MEQLRKRLADFLESGVARLLFVARARGVPAQDAEDVVQNVIATALDQINRGIEVDETKIAAWLEAILSGKIADYWRGRARRDRFLAPTSTDDPECAALMDMHAVVTSNATRLLAINEALAQLDWRHYIAFVLFHINGISGKEISRRLRWPVGTVHRIVAEARVQLAALLFAQDEESEPLRRLLDRGDSGEKT